MNSSQYKEEELLNSIIIDSEGFICGYIDNFSVEPDKIVVNIFDYNVKKVETPNEEELIKRLRELMPKKRLLQKEKGLDDVYEIVRETLHLNNRENVTGEHLIAYAKTKSIEIPKKEQNTKTKIGKGPIDWSYVDKVAFTDLGKCILLKKAIEAEKRGMAINEKVDYKSTEYLSGRMLIDSDAKIVGSVAKFLVGDPPGIMVNVERMAKEFRPDVEALKQSLIPSMFNTLKQFSNKVKKDLHLEDVTDDDLAIWAKKNKIEVKNKIIERKETELEIPIDWEKIGKIGDVVVLKESMDAIIANSTQELIKENSLFNNTKNNELEKPEIPSLPAFAVAISK
ncbi:MAG: hypothetical protein V1915_00765 [Candidatus Bathyarchaeota archaeon]